MYSTCSKDIISFVLSPSGLQESDSCLECWLEPTLGGRRYGRVPVHAALDTASPTGGRDNHNIAVQYFQIVSRHDLFTKSRDQLVSWHVPLRNIAPVQSTHVTFSQNHTTDQSAGMDVGPVSWHNPLGKHYHEAGLLEELLSPNKPISWHEPLINSHY
jgi:hypothetical protein